MQRHRTRKQLAAGAILLVVCALVYLRLSAAPVRAFESGWQERVGAPIAVDDRIRSMARRAQIDNWISGIPPIGRRQLTLDSVYRSPSGDYTLFFIPSVTHTVVLYHISEDGKIAWKTCTWTEA